MGLFKVVIIAVVIIGAAYMAISYLTNESIIHMSDTLLTDSTDGFVFTFYEESEREPGGFQKILYVFDEQGGISIYAPEGMLMVGQRGDVTKSSGVITYEILFNYGEFDAIADIHLNEDGSAKMIYRSVAGLVDNTLEGFTIEGFWAPIVDDIRG